MSKQAVKNLYKELIKTVKLLPKSEIDGALSNVRNQFREEMSLQDVKLIEEKIKAGESKLKFLRMKTPRVKSDNAGKRNFIVTKDGTLIEGMGDTKFGARLSHWGMTTDEMRFMNEQQLRRMNFMSYKKRT